MAQNRHWEQDKDATVYIGNIDERATPAMIYEIMVQMGPIQNVHMPRDRVTQSHQGFGFVEFRSAEDADYAAKCINGVKLYSKNLRVNKASADKQKANEVGANLFVGNLDPMVDEKILYDTFSNFGRIANLPKVARDDNGSSKGYAFLSFGEFESADEAIKNLHGQYILSKEVSVQYAFKKDGKGERHGDKAERELASQAKGRGIVPETQPVPPAFLSTPAPNTQAPPPHPAGFDPSSMAPGAAPIPAPSHVPAAGFAPQAAPRVPPPYGHPIPPPTGIGRGSAPLPPAPSGLPARPPQGQPGGFNNPADFHPGHGGFRPPTGSPVPQGFPVAPPPGFPGTPPPGAAGAAGAPGLSPGAPPGFSPPPGFQAPPPGFSRK
ncbi:unnamed protein product [Clonostachys byssicola]|uniref:RRM domain-containing protein n=1 Tax=Clonostachys byssicola TaxID=160290 RepID=A0A9N9UUL0_9HYPO|nr:unnamed protein product [Clonostachys byssicola]